MWCASGYFACHIRPNLAYFGAHVGCSCAIGCGGRVSKTLMVAHNEHVVRTMGLQLTVLGTCVAWLAHGMHMLAPGHKNAHILHADARARHGVCGLHFSSEQPTPLPTQ